MSADGVRVDPAASVVRAGAAVWPFELDLQAGTAVVGVDGRQFRLRPLLWREKVRLARFAHLGLPWIKRHFLQLALAGGTPPEGETEREALWALALWLNDPADETGVALNPAELAAATLTVCRAAGLKPADLDDRDALEIEALWRATRGPAPEIETDGAVHTPARTEAAAQTRIVVLPDPAVDPEEQNTSATEQVLTVDPHVVAVVSGAERPTEPPAGPAARESRPASQEPRSAPARRRFGEFRVVFPGTEAPGTPKAPAHGLPLPRQPRGEIERAAAAQEASIMRSQTQAAAMPPFMSFDEPELQAPGFDPPIRTGALTNLAFAAVEVAPRAATEVVEWRAEPLGAAQPVGSQLPEVMPPQQVPPPITAESVGRITLDHTQQDALFEALTGRLEQAAAELGIDTQG